MADIVNHPSRKLTELEKSRKIKEGIANSFNSGKGKGASSLDAIAKRKLAAAVKRQRLENFDKLKLILEDKFKVTISDDEAMVLLIHYLTMALD